MNNRLIHIDDADITIESIVAGVHSAILDQVVREQLEAFSIPVIDGATVRGHLRHCEICRLRLAFSVQHAWRAQVRRR